MITINYPKNSFLKTVFLLLVIVLSPFALFFNLVRIPFANNRIVKLNEIIKGDWVNRKRYIYLGFTSDCLLAGFARQHIIPEYGSHIIYDAWDSGANEWEESEPDTTKRVTTFWQDIAHEFDGHPFLILFTFPPGDTHLSEQSKNLHLFWPAEDEKVLYNGRELNTKEAEKLIKSILKATSSSWSN